MMLRTITIDVKADESTIRKMLERMAEQNRVLYGHARLLERTRWLNRDAIEAVERTRQVIEGFGSIERFHRICDQLSIADKYFKGHETPSPEILQLIRVREHANRQYRDFLQRHEVLWPGGFSDFIAIISSDDLNDPGTKQAIRRLAGWFGLKLKDPWAKRQLKDIARREGKDYALLLVQRYFPEAIRVTTSANANRGKREKIYQDTKGEGCEATA
jgi:hypothetical protein